MSKYIALDDAIGYECPLNEIWEDCINCPLNNSAVEPCKMGKWLNSLPTIEVSEDCISREDAVNALIAHFIPQTYTGEEVEQATKLARKIMEYAPSVVPAYQPITIKTDEKDSKSLKEQLKDIKTPGILMTEEEYGLFGCRVRTVEHAPSVVPTTEQSSIVDIVTCVV